MKNISRTIINKAVLKLTRPVIEADVFTKHYSLHNTTSAQPICEQKMSMARQNCEIPLSIGPIFLLIMSQLIDLLRPSHGYNVNTWLYNGTRWVSDEKKFV